MTFGLVKSIIEENLIESYKDEKTFKKSLNEFKHNVLNNKNLSKIYSLYDELSAPQGLNESDAKEFVTEGVILIQKLLQNVKLPKIVGESKIENKYQDIDDLVYMNTKLSLNERVNLKKKISKQISESVISKKETVQIPISTMVKIANQTIQNYLENLDESSKKELFNILKEETTELENKFNNLVSKTTEKLNSIAESENDNDTKQKIIETISKIKTEKFNQLNFIRLKKLEESL
jgi:hypothetical protein